MGLRAMNKGGHPQTLVAAQPGNRNREQHGLYAAPGRDIDPAAEAVAHWLMSAPHTVDLDHLAATEIGKLVVLLDRMDAALADGHLERRGQARGLIDMRLRLSGRLEKWLRQFGLTPASRAEFAKALAEGGLAAEIARRRADRRGGDDG